MSAARPPSAPSDQEVAIEVLRELRSEMRAEGDLVGVRVVERCIRYVARRLRRR